MRELNSHLAFAIFAGAFGSAFQHGYNTGVLNAPQHVLEDWISTSGCNPSPSNSSEVSTECIIREDYMVTMIWAFVVSIYCIGGMMGGSMVGLVSSYFGRKKGLLLNNLFVAVAGILMGMSKNVGSFQFLLAGRLVAGINSGLNGGLCPMYLSEVSPLSLRGALGTAYQLIVCCSILFSNLMGMQNALGNKDSWPILLAMSIGPGVLQLLTLPWCPESPNYLINEAQDEEAARQSLIWLRKTKDVSAELAAMKAELETLKEQDRVTLKEMLQNKMLRRPLVVSMMMMLAQQLSGINAAMFFSTQIFLSAGLDADASQMASVGMGGVNVIMTFVSMVLIDMSGRKTLMLAGLLVMLCGTSLLMFSLILVNTISWLSYVAIFAVYLFIVGFATGPGSIPWFFVTELFTQAGRPIATSIASTVNWTANFTVGLLFSPVEDLVGPYVFIIFIVAQILFILYVYLAVPETKNKSVEEVSKSFKY